MRGLFYGDEPCRMGAGGDCRPLRPWCVQRQKLTAFRQALVERADGHTCLDRDDKILRAVLDQLVEEAEIERQIIAAGLVPQVEC